MTLAVKGLMMMMNHSTRDNTHCSAVRPTLYKPPSVQASPSTATDYPTTWSNTLGSVQGHVLQGNHLCLPFTATVGENWVLVVPAVIVTIFNLPFHCETLLTAVGTWQLYPSMCCFQLQTFLISTAYISQISYGTGTPSHQSFNLLTVDLLYSTLSPTAHIPPQLTFTPRTPSSPVSFTLRTPSSPVYLHP